MSVRHGLLGLLAGEPGSGYDLTRRFEKLLGAIWPARHPQIYSELTRLADDGLIEVAAEGPRRRREYRVTDQGLAELRHWLTEVETDHTMRLDPVLRSLFFWLMSPGELRAHLMKEGDYYRARAEQYRGLAAEDHGEFADSPQSRALRLTAEAAIRLYQALADWADWATTTPLVTGEKPARGAQET